MTFVKKVQEILWPIEKSELKIFLPMGLLMFCVLFNFSILRSVKDALVIPALGAEVISILKLCVVLPSAFIFTFLYMYISNLFSSEKVFYIVVSCFLVIFTIFAFIIYPNQEMYHPSYETIEYLLSSFPRLKWFIKLYSKWSFAIVYLFGELWSVVVINLMFWQFVNHITDSSRAKRFYPILALIGNLGLIGAGQSTVYFANPESGLFKILNSWIENSINDTEITLKLIISLVIIFGVVAMLILRYIYTNIFVDMSKTEISHNPYTTQTNLSFIESVKLVFSSKYIAYILIMVLSYGLVINIVEGPWKNKIRQLYPLTNDYLTFMGNFNICMGISCVVMTILGSNILRKSWFVAALMTPAMMFITGTIFFVFVILGERLDAMNYLYFGVLAGAAQNILSKSTKYSLFDSTKEMAYIPLSVELRTKGKAAAEILGAKIGKSLGAFVQSFIFILYPDATFDTITPILMVIFLLVIYIWFVDLIRLHNEYRRM